MSGKLDGKISLVTGGTGGIGLAAAQRFVNEGAYVFVTGRRQEEPDRAAKLMSGHVTAIKADASNLDDLDKLFTHIKREKGRLDVVYANAGGGSFAPIGRITEEHFDQTFDTNVKGTLFTVQKALPMVPDGGSIIMTASTAGSTAMAAFSVYSAAKAAIRSFARCWTLEPASNSSPMAASRRYREEYIMQTFTKGGLDALLTPENCVLLLIDHQPFQLANVHSHDPTIMINNVTALARTAKAYDIPTILTTVNEERGGLIFKQVQGFFRIRRRLTVLSSMRGRTGKSSRR